jgi:autotransporter-associated beta strand protein
MNTTRTRNLRRGAAAALTGALLAAQTAGAGIVIKADNDHPLNLGSSWVGGTAPGTNDIARWASALSFRTYDLGADLAWLGMDIAADPGGNLAFNAGNNLTLGAEGIVSTPNRTITLNNALLLGANQTWNVASGTFIPQGGLEMDGRTLTLTGGATKQFKCPVTGSGTIVTTQGALKFSNQGNLPSDVDLLFKDSGSFTVDKDVVAGANRVLARSMTFLDGRPAGISSSSKGNVAITNQNQLAFGRGGQSRFSVYQQGAYHTTFASAILDRAPDSGSFLFTGNQLGLYPATDMSNSVNILFGTAPDLERTAGASGPTTLGILRGASVNHDNSEYGLGLATYDLDKGVRLLDFATEHTSSISDGEDAGNNVRLANVGGGSIVTNHLTAALTAVNSLSLDVTGPHGNAGIVLSGDEDAVLRLNSGILFARESGISSAEDDATDITRIDLPLDFNGKQGFILNAKTDGMSNGGGPALSFNVSPVNDDGNGILFAGNGSAYLQWPSPTAFTGPVIINSGWFRITGSDNNAVIPTRLILYGGSVQNQGNRIADTADIEIHGGNLSQKGGATNSGSGAHETFNDLFMTGGSYGCGADGTSSGSTTLNNAYLSGGTVTITKGHTMNVGGDIFLSEGARINLNNADSGYRPTLIMNNGTITITNATANAEWIPINLGNQNYADKIPPRVIFRTAATALVFVGNAANTNAAVINTATGTVNARMELNGTQTFDIGDGPAAADLLVKTDLVDDGATAGSLVKAGLGTLALDGTNTFTGGTAVEQGTLAGSGSLASDVTVAAGAAIAPGTPGTIGTLTVNADVDFAAGSVFKVDAAGEDADLLAVSGAVTGAGTVFVEPDVADRGEWLVMTAASIAPTFVSTDPEWSLSKRNGGTELWLRGIDATTIVIR